MNPDQGDLFAELDEAERVAAEEVGENVSVGSDDLDDVDSAEGLRLGDPPINPARGSSTEAEVP
jgi:hypothetical protein